MIRVISKTKYENKYKYTCKYKYNYTCKYKYKYTCKYNSKNSKVKEE